VHANARTTPHDQTTVDWALAVDYGTISTCAAVRTGYDVEILEIGFDRCLLSPVGVDEDGRFVTGRDAAAQARWDDGSVERAPKRALAAGTAVRLGDRAVDPIDLVAATLSRIAEESLRRAGGRPPERVVLAHPVHWASAETDRLLAAATRAGLAGLELVPTPVAVAAHHGGALAPGTAVAVYDLGCDAVGATVLRRGSTAFEVCGRGHLGFGATAVDEALLKLVAGHARGTDPEAWDRIWEGPPVRAQAMRERLLEAKAELSSRPWVAIRIDGIDSGVRVTRRELERAIEHRLIETVDELLRAVGVAGVEPAELDAVYLTGGASRMPRIAELIRERTGLTAVADGDGTAAVLGALARLEVRELVGAGGPAVPADEPVTTRFRVVAPDPDVPPAPDDDPPGADDAGAGPGARAVAADPGPAGKRPWRVRPVLVGVGMAALVAGVVTPIALSSPAASRPPATIPPPVEVVATTAQARPTASPTTPPPVAAARRPVAPAPREEPGLDARHLALFRDLADVGGVRWGSCAAYPSAETAGYVTAIQCSTRDPSLERNVVFYRLADAAAYAAMYRTTAGNVTGSGSCAKGGENATTWTDRSNPKGFLVCFDDPDSDDFRMAWASSGTRIAAVVSDPKAATVYTWWTAHATTLP
jgi:Hsp70 protein